MTISFLTRKVTLLSVIFLLTVLFSCKKDGELSPDFENQNLAIIFTDTFSIETSIHEEIPARTDSNALSKHLLGVYNDPIFGVKSSSIYTNIGLSNLPTDFGSLVVIDSIVLTLEPGGFYGKDLSSYTVNVFELTSSLSAETSYFSNSYTQTDPTLLGSAIFTPSLTGSILTAVDSVLHKHHLRVKLTDPTFISNLITNSPYSDNSAFNSIFKGLHIVTSDTASFPSPIASGTGAISYFNLDSALSGITVYYNNSDGDSLQEKFIFSPEIIGYTKFINDYTGTDIEKHLNNDVTKNGNRIYVSTMTGLRTKIKLPNIKELTKEGNISINKAEITFNLEAGTDLSPDDVLKTIALTGINESGGETVLADLIPGGLSHYGGAYNSTTKSFTFNITKHIHKLIKSTTTDYGMYLRAKGALISANRVVLQSENSPISKLKLEITYTKL